MSASKGTARTLALAMGLALSLVAAGRASGADAAPPPATGQVVQLTARKWAFSPEVIRARKGVPLVIELRSLDRRHGFNLPAFRVRSDVSPEGVTRIRLVPDQVGTFPFHCDVFCGEGHEAMEGMLVVTE
jgi:cytochrome c oxidase subunit 2